MEYELVPNYEYALLPVEKEARFIKLEEVARKNMINIIKESPSKEDLLKTKYMSTVFAAAEAGGIQGLYNYKLAGSTAEGFRKFSTSLDEVITKIKFNMLADDLEPALPGLTVQLSVSTRTLLTIEIEKIRGMIDESNYSDEKKRELSGKLDDFLNELQEKRSNIGRIFAVVIAVAAFAQGGTGTLADIPDAVSTITTLIGKDKEAEDKEYKRLNAPEKIKLLTGPDKNKSDIK